MKNIKKILYVILLLGQAIILAGCDFPVENDMRNIEERDYATVMLVEEGKEKTYSFQLGIAQAKTEGKENLTEEWCSFECDDLETLSDCYENVKGKDLSLTHLKVILMEKVFPASDRYPIIMELGASREIAKTCPVIQVQELEQFTLFRETFDKPVGSYINDLVRGMERKGNRIPWLKDCLKVIRENDSIMVYDLEVKGEGLELVCRSCIP